MAILNTNDLPTTFNTVLKDGTYAFLVEKFEEKKDRSDNVYMHLELKLISDDVKLKIFDRFYQVADVNRSNAGFGLGLYIAAEIVNRQNGKIWVDSEPGKGSTFYFSLPIESQSIR